MNELDVLLDPARQVVYDMRHELNNGSLSPAEALRMWELRRVDLDAALIESLINQKFTHAGSHNGKLLLAVKIPIYKRGRGLLYIRKGAQ